MGYILTNAPAILAATLASLAVGALYALLRGVRRRPGRPGGRITPGLVLLAALAEFWLAAILAGALILAPPQAGAWTMALMSAVVIWIGFVLPTLLVTNGFDGLPTRSASRTRPTGSSRCWRRPRPCRRSAWCGLPDD